jgi:hypothetical protein
VNGDGAVDWEEFTSYCIEEGVLAVRSSNNPSNEGSTRVQYVEDKTFAELIEEMMRAT